MEERKLCPFCGSEARIKMLLKENKETYFCECWLCSCRTQDFNTKEEAIEAWNRRVDNG
jgi:Lar family restriction alleviation protein